jgi:allantoinase
MEFRSMADACDWVLGGSVVLPDRVIENGYVAVRGEKIAAVGEGAGPRAQRNHRSPGCFILPGVIDGQVHTGSQAGREGIGIATRAAAAGGVTAIVDMPYDDPEPVTDANRLRSKIAAVEREAHVDVALYGTIAKDKGVGALLPMIEAGAGAFKFSTYEAHPVRFPRIAPADMLEAFRIVAPSGLACGVHNENQEMVDRLARELQARGITGPQAHGLSRPPIAEALAIAEIYELGAASGARAHVVHCSIGRGFEICEGYRAQGVRASIETCVQYLTLDEGDVMRLGPLGKVNPPIRSRTEVEKLWAHVAAGHVDFVSSDHVAWGLERKRDRNIFGNASGAPGLESLLPAFYTGCAQRGLPLTVIARLLSAGPAKHFRLHPRKGEIRVGADADLCVLSPRPFVFRAADTLTAAEWSPYEGMTFAGRAAATFVRGSMVWDGHDVLANAGSGRFVRPVRSGLPDHSEQVSAPRPGQSRLE